LRHKTVYFAEMATTSYQTQLESVQGLIASLEADETSSVTFQGRSVTFLDIGTLYAREKWLRKMANRSANGGIRMRGATIVHTR